MPTETPPGGTPFELAAGEGASVVAVFVEDVADVSAAVEALGLAPARCALVVVGGAGEMTDEEVARATRLFDEALAPLAEGLEAVVVDGGTDVGVMRLMGRARERRGGTFPLVGVVVADLVGLGQRADAEAGLERHHTHFLLVRGSDWGTKFRLFRRSRARWHHQRRRRPCSSTAARSHGTTLPRASTRAGR
jgi:hypothetical protein